MHKAVDAYESKLEGFVESLDKKIAHYSGERRMNTPKQRQQASDARYEAHCLESARAACLAMIEGVRNGTLPEGLRLKSMAAICEATKERRKQGSGYYSEVYPDLGNYYSDDPTHVALREWIDGGNEVSDEEREQRAQKLKLQEMLSEVRGAKYDGFFPTPEEIVRNTMMPLCHPMEGKSVLEPSAGIGSIAEVAREYGSGEIICFEVVPKLCEILKAKGFSPINDDFLTCAPVPGFDLVLMNPPYERDQSIDHVMHAYQFLADGGRLLAVLPAGMANYEGSKTKKRQAWAHWLDYEVGCQWFPLPEGAFKSAFNPTGVNVALLRIDR